MIPNLATLLDEDGINDTEGTVSSWTESSGQAVILNATGDVQLVENWRNGKKAVLPTVGFRLQDAFFPTVSVALGGSTWTYATQIPTTLSPGVYSGSSCWSGKPFPLAFFNDGGVLKLGTNSGPGVVLSSWNLNSHAGKDAFIIIRHQASAYRFVMAIEGEALLSETVANPMVPVGGVGLAIGGWTTSGGEFPYPTGMFCAHERAMSDAEMSGLAKWGACEFAL